jgi:hypothetical protein
LKETRKPFFIDPMTFVFARDISIICRNGSIRRSYKKLLEDYGAPFSNCLTGSCLVPRDFFGVNGDFDDSKVANACKQVLDFQRTKCMVSTPFSKYFKVLGREEENDSLLPSFLVAPYFFANRYGSDWYKLSLKFAKQAYAMKGEARLFPVICLSQEVLWDEQYITAIVRDYAGFDGYIIWIDNLDEERVSSMTLVGLKSLISKLSAYRKPVYSLYGGFLCDLLGKFGLTGYSSGICYGEDRSVDAKGGGAGKRYYVPAVHVKVSADLANAFFAESENNRGLMCNCPTCFGIRNKLSSALDSQRYSDAFFSIMDFLDYRRHFVNSKFQEMTTLTTLTKAQVRALLDQDIQAVSNADPIVGHPPALTSGHLRVWRTLFE